MKKIYNFILLVALVFMATSTAFTEELSREEGLSAHVMPRRVAELDKGKNLKWGFIVSQSHDLKPPLQRPTFQTADELLAYYSQQPKKIQENGIWVILTHPDSYSDEEKENVEKLKRLCKEKGIPLFICRGMDLPNGWKRES